MIATLFLLAAVLSTGVDSIPAHGFAGSRVVRTGQKILVRDASGKDYLMVRARPFSNTNLIQHVRVETDGEGVTIDAREAFDAGAVDIPIDPMPAWTRTNVVGRDCLFLSEWSGDGAALRWDICGDRLAKNADGFRKSVRCALRPRRHVFESAQRIPDDMKYVGSFVLLTAPGKGPVKWYGMRGGSRESLEVPREAYGAPKLLFHADFDAPDAKAVFAGGEAAPVRMEGVEFVKGGGRLGGGAFRFSRNRKSLLAYRTDGNVRPLCGAIAFWAKESDASISNKKTRTVFALPSKDGRPGAGDVEMGWDGNRIRALRGDYQRTDHVRWGYEPTPGWHHYIFVWSDTNRRLESFFIDGQSVPPGRVDVADRPTSEAIGNRVRLDIDRQDGDFPVFHIGSLDGEHVFDGLIDDVRVYSAPLDVYEARAIFDHDRAVEVTLDRTFATEGARQRLRATAKRRDAASPRMEGATAKRRDAASPRMEGAKLALIETGTRFLVRDASGRVVATSDDGAFDLSLPAGAYRVSVEGLEDDPLCSAPYWVLKPGNPHEAPALDRPGVPSGLKLVATWTADDFFGEAASRRFASEAQEKANRFRAVGRCAFGELDGRRYLESGTEKDNRFALRFKLRKDVPLHCFEFDYPDDKARTGEIIIEPCKKPSDHYEMQCGYICGLEHRLTGRMLTHRTLYWTASDDVVAVFRSLHGQPAAVAGIRVYEVEGAALPVAALPPAKGRTERRHFAYYSEDMPINFCFSADQSTPASFDRLFNRLAAVMKYVGQDTLAYPAVWYAGVVDGTGGIYNPHGHAKDYLQGIFEKFDREGLSFIPLVHRFAMPYPQRQVTRERMRDGSLHDSPVAIFDTGLPNWGGVHFSCSDFNIQHPLVQRRYLDDVDHVLAQGRGHPSFKGIGFHLAKYSPGWYGGLESGYNDYSVAAFERATGVKVPVDRADPLRGKAYAKWIAANCREKWIDWRCATLADFYEKVAARMRAVDPKLRLWLNCWPMFFEYPKRADAMDPGMPSRMFREYGIDGEMLRSKIPNLVLGTMDIPAWSRDELPSLSFPEELRIRARDIPETASFYEQSVRGGFASVAHFDSYFESAVGETKGSNVLSCDWMTELGWRVACLNPSGRNVLARYAIPLKFADVMMFSKGGFLCGLYGTEETLAPWMRNFRALPAVQFADVESGDAAVTVRRGEADGGTYWYFVNTTAERREFRFALPEGTRELVSDRPAREAYSLDAYELISFFTPGRASGKAGVLSLDGLDVGFALRLAHPGRKGLTVSAADMASLSVTTNAETVTAVWRGHPVCGSAFAATAEFRRGDGGWLWRFRYEGNAVTNLDVESVSFPVVEAPRSDETGVVRPKSLGLLEHPDWKALAPGARISSDAPMSFRFIAACDGSANGLYVDERGARGYAGSLVAENGSAPRTVRLSAVHDLPVSAGRNRAYELPYGGLVRRFAGGWYEAARIYRDWVGREPWVKASRARDRTRLRDVALWLWQRGEADRVIAPVERFVAETGLRPAVDWYWWHRIPYDTQYPFFWPPREGEEAFRAAVARMKAKGVFSQVYTNGMSWDCDDPSWERGGGLEAVRYPKRGGAFLSRMYNVFTRHRLAHLCGEAPKFHDHFAALAKTLADCGLDGLYMDQIGCGALGCCWNPSHRHDPGGGTAVADGYRRLFARIRAENPGLLLSTEEPSEEYLAETDDAICLWQSSERFMKRGWQACEPIPVFQALHHGETALFGSFAILGGKTAWDPTWPDENRWRDEAEWERMYPRDQFALELVRGVVFGNQPCVHNLTMEQIADTRLADDWRFLKDTAAFYFANREFFFDGEMLNPGALACATVPFDFVIRGTYTTEKTVKTVRTVIPSVLHSVWRAPSGRTAAVLVNWTRKPVRYSLKSPDVVAQGEIPARTWKIVEAEPIRAAGAKIVDCSEESAFAVIGSSRETDLSGTAKALGAAIGRREGTAAPSVETLALPEDGDAARKVLLGYCAKVRDDRRVKRVGALVTPSVYAFTTNLMLYTCRTWPEAAKFPMGGNKHADMLEFGTDDPITEETLDFVCGYRIDWNDPVCSFESGEPPLTAAEAVAAMDAGDWVDAEVEATRRRLAAWQGGDEAVLIAFECDLHVFSPVRGKWGRRSDLTEGGFCQAKRFARVANTFGVDLAADLGDLGYDFSGRYWKHACKGERAARMAIQGAVYDLIRVPFMAVQGNHDTHWESLDGFGRLFNPDGLKRTEGFAFGPTRGYGYRDIPEKRTRVFFVNTSEIGTGGGWAIRPDQVTYMRQAVAETPDGWTVVFFSHDCLHRTAGNRDWRESMSCKATKTYCDMRALLESIASGGRLKLAGIYCGDSHFNRLHVENGVRYFICDAAFMGHGPKNLLVHIAAVKPATGEARLFRVGRQGEKGDL